MSKLYCLIYSFLSVMWVCMSLSLHCTLSYGQFAKWHVIMTLHSHSDSYSWCQQQQPHVTVRYDIRPPTLGCRPLSLTYDVTSELRHSELHQRFVILNLVKVIVNYVKALIKLTLLNYSHSKLRHLFVIVNMLNKHSELCHFLVIVNIVFPLCYKTKCSSFG